ncbi:hypothetical protein LTR24_000168 [Lithohypha guttulata]|uniref:Uncharacterized protein n=1 Tax=Lithohypha guttulata TaxID=1690604 RepID=A0ABR0KQ81_9EURO|nr:hypothetical protein LTR24_000168 [Lithohypha guttulata]
MANQEEDLVVLSDIEFDEEPPAFRLAGEEVAELRKRLHKPMNKSGGSIKAGKRGPKKPLKKAL